MKEGKSANRGMPKKSPVFDATASNWKKQVLQSDVPVAVDFWHENCVWCRRLDPVYESLAREFDGRMKFAKLHVFNEEKVANSFSIMGTPTVKFFCNGREVYEVVGFRPEATFRQEVERVLENYKDCIEKSTPIRK